MSSSVSTNQGPRETKSLTELFSDSSSSNSGPHRLSPIAQHSNQDYLSQAKGTSYS